MRLELSLEISVVIRFGHSRICLQEGYEFRGPNLQFEEREKIVIHLVHKALEDVVSDSVPRNSALALLLVATGGVRALVVLRALLAAGVVNRRVAGIFELGECVVHCIGHGKLGVAIRVLLGDVHGEDILDIASGRFVAGIKHQIVVQSIDYVHFTRTAALRAAALVVEKRFVAARV